MHPLIRGSRASFIRHLAALAVIVLLGACNGDTDASPGVQGTLQIDEGDNQTASTGERLPVDLLVVAENTNGGYLDGYLVDWSVVSGGGTLTSASTTTISGFASNSWTLGPAIGAQQVKATLRASDPELSVIFTATAVEAPPPPPASLCTVFSTIGDSYFQDANWDAVDVSKDGTASQSPLQVLTGGSPAGTDFIFTQDPAYRRLTTTVGPPAGGSGTSRISTAYIRNDGSENPSTGGAITRLVFWQDDIVESGPSSLAVTWGIAVRQGGTVYTKALGTLTSSTWQPRGPIEVSAADFGSPGPDFSVTGGPIKFGFFRSVTSAGNPTRPNTVVHGIDNWQVRICRN
jgi:hypothetical protein